MKISILFIANLFFSIFLIHCQKDLKFTRYTTDQGLVQDYIFDILQDSKGFIWVATKGGVSRFDGMEFKNFIYIKGQQGTISNGWVKKIAEDSRKMLWFGLSGDSIFLMKLENEKFVDFSDKIPTQKTEFKLSTLTIDSENYIWLGGSTNNGLMVFHPDTKNVIEFYNNSEAPNIVKNGTVLSIFEDNQGFIWIGGDIGLCRYDKKNDSFKTFAHNPGDQNTISTNYIYSIYQDSKGTFWFGTNNGGLNKYIPAKNGNSGDHFECFRYDPDNKNSIPSNTIYYIFEDIYKRFWMGTVNGVILMDRENNTFQNFRYDEEDDESLNSNTVRDIFYDNSDNIWFGTRLGLAKVKNQKFKTLSYSKDDNSISNNKIIGFAELQNKRLLLGTIQTIDLYDRLNQRFEVLLKVGDKNKLLSGPPMAIHCTNNNDIWIGTWAGGLQHVNLETGKTVFYTNNTADTLSINASSVFAISEYRDNKLLIGTWGGGLNILDRNTGKFSYFLYDENDTSSISSNFITKIYQDSNKDVWIGTLNNLNLMQEMDTGIKFKRFFHNEKPQIHDLIEMRLKAERYLWVATNQSLGVIGLSSFNHYQYTSEDGLPAGVIRGLLIDSQNNLWCSSSVSLFKIIVKELSEERSNKGFFDMQVKIFKKSDGLQKEFLERSCMRLHDGSMVFGGTRGFSIFHPDSIKENKIKPQVVFTELLLHNKIVGVGDTINNQVVLTKSITDTDSIILNHENNAFSIRFAALHYNIPESNQYLYWLEGYDANWQQTDASKREVIYMNLPHGDYTFYFKGSNSDGIWNEEPTTLFIRILPPWWQTWWFRILAFLAATTIIVGFYRYRLNALKRQKRILEQKVIERTAELREANSQLEEKQEEILQQNEELITKNDEIQQQKEELVTKNEEIELSKQKLEKAFNNITILSEFGQKITATFDFDAINKMIYDYVSSLMDTSAFGIGIYNDVRKTIDYPYFMENGKSVPYFFKSLSNEKSLTVKCFKNLEEIFINDLSNDYKIYLGELPEMQTSELPSSVIHLPLIVEDRSIGTITVNSFKINAYNYNDLANLRTLASYISIALDNSKAYRIIRSKNEQISGSIRYGQTIQQAMLPPKEQIDKYFENFILFRPKDIVSGDFYWFATIKKLEGLDSDKQRNLQGLEKGLDNDNSKNLEGFEMGFYFLAVVDCTGHGVPGAFMSMIGSRLLNDIIIERKIYSPATILEELNIMIRKALRQDTTDNNDGMDVCLCRFQKSEASWQLTYAGAKRPLIYYKSATKAIETIEGTRKSIGGFMTEKKYFSFIESTIEIGAEDVVYLSTDGFVDQCNPQKRKFTQKRLNDLLAQICHKPLLIQKKDIEGELDSFQKGFEQRDDITLVGLKLK